MILKSFLKLVGVIALILSAGEISRGAELPSLAQLKLAAEAGNAEAQYKYSQRFAIFSPGERVDWLIRSAEQGFAPAQDDLAAHYALTANLHPDKKRAMQREAVRWASRAAYQGLASAQVKLAQYYRQGAGVSEDPLAAYMWIQIAANTSGADQGNMGEIMVRSIRDQMILNTSSDNIREGQRRAAAFTYPDPSGLNPIEADLLYSQLKLVGIFHLNGHSSAAVNNVRFNPGDTKDVKVDDQPVTLTCVSIESNYALFKIPGTKSPFALTLKR